MIKRNISIMIVGLVAVLLLTALPVAAEEGQAQPKSLSEWLTTLSQEQHEQFFGLIKEHLARRQASKGKLTGEHCGFFEGLSQDLQLILTEQQFAHFQAFFQRKPKIDQTKWGVKKCFACVYAWLDVNGAVTDLNSAKSLFDESYCDPGPHFGCGHAIYCSITEAIIWAEFAQANLPSLYTDCNCSEVQYALTCINEAIADVDAGLRRTSKYNCSPTPWLNSLNYAKNHLLDARDKMPDCISISCNL